MGEIGFEPMLDIIKTDLQSVTFNHSVILPVQNLLE
jgi:hypothetical protein